MLSRTLCVCIDEILTRKAMTLEEMAHRSYIAPERVRQLFLEHPSDLTVDELQRIVIALDLTKDDVLYARHALPLWVWKGFAARAFERVSEAANDVARILKDG